jgi:hypothetical protein
MLDTCDIRVDHTGNTGRVYFSQRLLSKDATLSPRLDNMRRIASRLAHENGADGVTYLESYAAYINKLSSLLISQGSSSFGSLFGLYDHPWRTGVPDYDFLSAAAYTGHLSLVRELCQDDTNTVVDDGTLGNPYKCAALGGHVAVIDHLLQTAELHGRNTQRLCASSMLYTAAKAGALDTVQHLLASPWKPNLFYIAAVPQRTETFRSFHFAMSGPNSEIFIALRRFREASSSPEKTLSQEQLAHILWHCCSEGYTEPAAHAIDLGAPVDGNPGEVTPLRACKNVGTMRLLLQRGAKTSETGAEIAEAAKRGRLDMVKLLVEHGESVCSGTPRPIVSAVDLEHEVMFRFLVKHGGLGGGDAGELAVKRAREKGLQSMVALLEEQGVTVNT